MKKIELKKVPIVAFGEKGDFLYKDQIQAIMESPANPESGANLHEVRRSIRVLDALEQADDFLELEDADFDYLLERIRNVTWASNNKVFVEFVDYFEELDG